jgi:hypothetical protein
MRGVTRIVIKTGKGFTMFIDNPTIMIGDSSKDSFVVFGEMEYFKNELGKNKQGAQKVETKKID